MLRYHHAKTPEEIEMVRMLIARVYAEDGYTLDEDHQSGIGTYLSYPTTTVLYATHDDEILGTISVARGSDTTFPMDSIFKEEINQLPYTREHIAEVCQFAIDTRRLKEAEHHTVRPLELTVGLLGFVLAYAKAQGLKSYCFSVNPKHASFYESIGCESLGPTKPYPSVNNAPACGYHLDLHSLHHTEEAARSSILNAALAQKYDDIFNQK